MPGDDKAAPKRDHTGEAEERQHPGTVVFTQPLVRPGTPEARAAVGPHGFESNVKVAFLAAEQGHEVTDLRLDPQDQGETDGNVIED